MAREEGSRHSLSPRALFPLWKERVNHHLVMVILFFTPSTLLTLVHFQIEVLPFMNKNSVIMKSLNCGDGHNQGNNPCPVAETGLVVEETTTVCIPLRFRHRPESFHVHYSW